MSSYLYIVVLPQKLKIFLILFTPYIKVEFYYGNAATKEQEKYKLGVYL